MQQPSRLMNKNFVLLWQGQSINRLGLQAFAVAMLFWIKHATDSATLMGLLLMLSTLPGVLFSPLGGALADRVSRRRILIVTDILSGIAVLTLAALYFLAPQSTNLILVWLFIVSLSTSILSAFFSPAISAAVPDLVPPDKVAAANSLIQLASQISIFIGQGLGGVFYRILGAPILFLINGLTYLFAGVSESFITIPQVLRYEGETGPSAKQQVAAFKEDILEGLRYVWRTGGLRELVLVSSLLSFFTVPFITLLPYFVEDTLKLPVDWYGFILAAYGAASLAGYAVAGLLRLGGRARARTVLAALVVSSALYGLIGLARHQVDALVLSGLVGAMEGFVMVNLTTLVQVTTPSDIRGRVFGVLATLSGALAPLAMGLAGMIADLLHHNIPLIYMASGILMTGLTLWLCLNRELGTFLAREKAEERVGGPAIEGEVVSGVRGGEEASARPIA